MEQVVTTPSPHFESSTQHSAQRSGVSPEIPVAEESRLSAAKKYHTIKLIISLSESAFLLLLTLFAVAFGWTRLVSSWAYGLVANDLSAFLVFIAMLGVFEILFTLPVHWYAGFYLEHKYQLSNQTLPRWMWENLKAIGVSIPIAVPLLVLFYLSLQKFGNTWWIPVGVVAFLFSVVLARLAPTLIFPLFYKFIPLENASLKGRLIEMCKKENLSVNGVLAFNMSKNTKKANAGFAGIGKAKRIILADTLLQNFTEDEIATVFAHEIGHYRYGHILKSIFIGALTTFLGLYLAAALYNTSLSSFGFESITELAALPLLGVWLGVYGFVAGPLNNMLSRSFERQADRFAFERIPDRSIFVSTMQKLASINLADPSPHPLVEFLFYSHPSIEKRIHLAEHG